MNLYFRVLWLIIRRIFSGKKIDIFGACTTKFRVNPLDLDLNLHMNNGRYLSIMDLGRVDLMVRAKVFWKIVLHGYYPVVVSESIKFRKSLEAFQTFEVTTQMNAWDENDIYLIQQFTRNGQLYAEGFIKGRFRKRGRKTSLKTREIFEYLGVTFEGLHETPVSEAHNLIDSRLARKDAVLMKSGVVKP